MGGDQVAFSSINKQTAVFFQTCKLLFDYFCYLILYCISFILNIPVLTTTRWILLLVVMHLGHKDFKLLAKLGLDGLTASLYVSLWQDFRYRSPDPMQRDRQVDRQAGQQGSLLPVSSLPRSALAGGIQGPRSCKQKPDPVRRVWVSPPRRPADDTRSGPALGTGLIWCLTKGPSLRLSITAHIWCLCRERCPFRFLSGVKAGIRPSHYSLRNPLTQMTED